MIKTKIYNYCNKPSAADIEHVVSFLFEHLEQYGDTKDDIEKAVNYALKASNSFGGFVLEGLENGLVYIATHKDSRGKGIGKQMMLKALEIANGNIALHVEPDNPARFLYEKIGFTNKYLEMRYIK